MTARQQAAGIEGGNPASFRGLCHHGAECDYLHRVPTEADEARHRCDYSHDIFGRERGPSSRDGRKKGLPSSQGCLPLGTRCSCRG